jgi:trehalose synthase
MALYFPSAESLPLDRYFKIFPPEQVGILLSKFENIRDRMQGRVIWNVSSSATGGGVAEMVRSLLAYSRGAGADARWAVIQGSHPFFQVTKRLHNALHGYAGDGSSLGKDAREIYEKTNRECAEELASLVRPNDLVVVHDPQPAGMISELAKRGTQVIWRYHVGSDVPNDQTTLGWNFLTPYLEYASAYVFTRASFVPQFFDADKVLIIPPSIDPFSAKNQILSRESIRAILTRIGIFSSQSSPSSPPTFLREDGTPCRVDRMAHVLREAGPVPWGAPVVAQVSRWDRLKDPLGVMLGFARGCRMFPNDSYLLLVGPDASSIADDPEDLMVYTEVAHAWHSLHPSIRSRIHLVSLPTLDIDENAAMVNAIQRYSSIIVQKSLYEGFGLTVTEAMWKGRPVVASAVGGIQDQIEDGVQGLLLKNPLNLDAFAQALKTLFENPALCEQLGKNAHAQVLDHYLGIYSLLRYGDLIEKLDEIPNPVRSEVRSA